MKLCTMFSQQVLIRNIILEKKTQKSFLNFEEKLKAFWEVFKLLWFFKLLIIDATKSKLFTKSVKNFKAFVEFKLFLNIFFHYLWNLKL